MSDRSDLEPDRTMNARDVVSVFGAMWSRAYDQQFLRLQKHYVVAQKLNGVRLVEFKDRLQRFLRDPEAGAFSNHSFFHFVSQYNSYAKPCKSRMDAYAED